MKACLLSLVAACALEPPALPRPPSISAAFDSGNVEVVDVACGDGGHEFRLKIRPDAYTRFTDETAHFQWFHFRASGVRDARCRFVLENAGDARRPVVVKTFSRDFENKENRHRRAW